MNILHLISSYGFFGAERVVSELCSIPVIRGFSNNMAFLVRDKKVIDRIRKALKNPEKAIGISCSKRLDFKAIKELKKLIVSQKIDILHSHGYKSDFYAAILKHLCSRPLTLFATNHNWIGRTFSEKIYQTIDAFVLRRFERVIAVSEQVRQEMAERLIPIKKIEVVGNGIETEDPDFKIDRIKARQLLGIPENRIVIGNIARLTAEKAHSLLIEALNDLRKDFADIQLVMVGDGPERSELERLVKHKRLGNVVRFTGNIDRARRCYAAFDIFALPSFSEGLPVALLEAMAACVPVVASAVGDIPCVVKNGVSGLLISPNDQDQLLHALQRLITEPDLRRKLSNAGLEKVQNEYSSRKMAKRYFDLYIKSNRMAEI